MFFKLSWDTEEMVGDPELLWRAIISEADGRGIDADSGYDDAQIYRVAYPDKDLGSNKIKRGG